jgi:uncharacterized protein GlcG (DUF336 family)
MRFSSIILIVAAAGSCFLACAQTPRPVLESAIAEALGEHCQAFAGDRGTNVAVAVYDHGGNMVYFSRMDGTSVGVAEVAMWKAQSAAVYETATATTREWNVPNAPRISGARGGLPLFTDSGFSLGGIGVSGGSSEFDEECAAYAAQEVGLLVARPG